MKAQVMKLAHKLAKKSNAYVIFKNYRKALKEAMRKAWQIVKAEAVKVTGLAKECIELVLSNLEIKTYSKEYAKAVQAINEIAKADDFKQDPLGGVKYVSSVVCDRIEDAVCDILGW